MQPGNDPGVILDDGILVGVYLSADATSEHEWGIDGIRSNFGIDKTQPGILSRKVTRNHPSLQWVEWPDGSCGFGTFSEHEVKSGKVPYGLDRFPSKWDDDDERHEGDIAGAWDGSTFGVRVKPEHRDGLKALCDAFATGDIVIMIGGGPVEFAAHGLIICRHSALPPSVNEDILKKQEEAREVAAYEASTDIKTRLRKAGCQFGYLGARKMQDGTWGWWLNNGKNPNRHYEDLYGWYTLEQLEQWAEGTGPLAAFPQQPGKRSGRKS